MAAPHLDKARQREAARGIRAQAAVDVGHAPGDALAGHVLRDLPPPPGTIVSGYWPMGDEIDVRPLLIALHARGHTLGLPITPHRGEALTFRLWQPGDTLVAERFGTHCPPAGVAVVRPDWLLVPLLAFDARGHRLGYGGGFYDRTLAALPDAVAVGCAYAAQRVDAVATGPYDAPLHAVATEHGVTRFTEGR